MLVSDWSSDVCSSDLNSFAASGDFAATSTGASACPTSPATLAAGANCTINVTFTPTASGARSEERRVGNDGGASAQMMTLSGNGTEPGVGLAPKDLAV